ncbi:MAG: hypothetical protein LAT67_15795 [Balneolales bacterium]|nr:hypothetical protein [Balneolales bacterium]
MITCSMHGSPLPAWFALLLSGIIALALTGCSGTKSVQSVQAPSSIVVDGDLSDWPSGSLRSNLADDFDVAITNNSTHVYIGVSFRNNRTFQMARDHGLRIYIEGEGDFRRSFAIVFPTGIVEALGDIPGARRNYLENPSWQNLPENQRLVNRAEERMGERVQIIRRTHSRDSIRPASVSMEQLRANGIDVGLHTGSRVMSLEVKIPIDDGSGEYFAIRPDNNGRFYIDFEIEPMSYEQITGESVGFETVDVQETDSRSGRTHRSRQQLSVSNPRLYALLNYSYRNRVRVTLDR